MDTELAEVKAIYYEEGRITPNGANWQYEYTISDHLGNARVSFADLDNDGVIDENTEILQTQSYYPFGLEMSGLNSPQVGTENKYKFNGYEEVSEVGWTDFGWRQYDASIARWNRLDRFSEKYVSRTPFGFSVNNPIRFKDVRGDSIELGKLFLKYNFESYARFGRTKTGGTFISDFLGKYNDHTVQYYVYENDPDGMLNGSSLGWTYASLEKSDGSLVSLGNVTAKDVRNSNLTLRFQVGLNDFASGGMEGTEIIGHESLVHVAEYMADFDKLLAAIENGELETAEEIAEGLNNISANRGVRGKTDHDEFAEGNNDKMNSLLEELIMSAVDNKEADRWHYLFEQDKEKYR